MNIVNEYDLKKQMCEIGHRIWQRGYCAGNEGNHSVRVSDDRYLCTPTGISKGFLDPEDICVVDAKGNQIETNARGRKRTSEVLVHLAIYKKRPDVQAVIHSHPPHAVAFCLAGLSLPEGIHPEAEVFLGRVINAKYATPGGPKLPESFISQITPETNTVLMQNHGSVNFAETLTDTYYKLEILDNYCKQLILTRQLGQVNVLSTAEMTELLEVKKNFGMDDPRLACAPAGCVGVENQAFLASFADRPATAVSATDGGKCNCSCGSGNGGGSTAGPPAGLPAPHRPQPAASSSAGDLEPLVQAITDQILARQG